MPQSQDGDKKERREERDLCCARGKKDSGGGNDIARDTEGPAVSDASLLYRGAGARSFKFECGRRSSA